MLDTISFRGQGLRLANLPPGVHLCGLSRKHFFFIAVQGFQPFEDFGALHHESGLFEEAVEVIALEGMAQGVDFAVQKD